MDMSAACSPPIQPNDAIKGHPRYSAYQRYLSAMNRQMVTGMTFQSWSARMDEKEFGFDRVYEVTSPSAQLARGWYKNRFHPGSNTPETFGPFKTEAEAETA